MITEQNNIQIFEGYAAADKANDSRELLVFIPTLLPFMQGDLQATEVSNSFNVSDGETSTPVEINMTNAILCEYRGADPNRLIPPDVRRGAMVVVTKDGDTDKYYWDATSIDIGSRRTERLIIGVSANLENSTTPNQNNCYTLEFNTRTAKCIKITTTKELEEEFAYTFWINPEDSEVTLADDVGNTFYINSKTPEVSMTNKSESTFKLLGENILMACNGNITLDAKEGEVIIHSGTDTVINTDKSFEHNIQVDSTTTTQGNVTTTTQGNTKHTTQGDFSRTVEGKYKLSVSGDTELTSAGKLDMTSSGNMTISSSGELNMSSSNAMTIQSSVALQIEGAPTSVNSTGSLTLGASGGLNMSFTGSGTCTATGGSLTMRMSSFNIEKG